MGLLGMPTRESRKYLKTERKPRGFLARTIIHSTVLYALYWILYACPAGVPGSESPQVCKRYYDLKHAFATKAVPYVQPYYEQYAGPYISKGQPYYEQANALYGQYGKPVVEKTGSAYSNFVHPVALRGANTAKAQYDAKLGPIVDKHVSQLTSRSQKVYNQYLGRHVSAAKAQYDAVVAPYVTLAHKKASEVYTFSYPYAEAGLARASDLYAAHAHPRLMSFLAWVNHLVETKILPTIRRFYLLHIEPQVNKISDRLFQFNVSTGFASLEKVSPDAIESSISASILASVTPSVKIESSVIAGETHTVEIIEPSIDAKLQSKIHRELINDLLTVAESNIDKEGAAGEAALNDKLDDLLPALIKKEEILCEDYLTQLESVTVEEVEAIERTIVSFAGSESNKGRSAGEISDDLRPYFVKAGKNIHSNAVEVKAHLSTVLEGLEAKVQKVSYIVYDRVQTAGQHQKKIPEQKLRYELEGVSKKELKRLDALDAKIKHIETTLNAAAQKVLKSYTKTLSTIIKDTEKKVETLAGGAANKLHTLKNIGPKKITVGDVSQEFGHGYLPVGAMLGAQAIYNQLSTGIYGAPEPSPEVPEQVMNSLKSLAAGLSTNIDTASIASAAKFAASVASEQGVNAGSAVSSALAGVDTDAIASSASSVASAAKVQATGAYAAASKAAGDVDTDKLYASIVDAQEYVGEQAADIAALASNAVYGTQPAFTESLASRASEAFYGTEVPLADSIKSQVNDAYAGISEKASEYIHGTPVAFTDSIASKASEAFYGTETPVVDSIIDQLHEKYTDVKEKAAEFVQGSKEDILEASKSASSLSSSLSSEASKSSSSLSKSASSASSVASVSARSASSLASKSSSSLSVELSRSASSASSLASKSASSASSLASKSASSASSVAAASKQSLEQAAKSATSEGLPVVQSVVDKAWEDYANARDKVEDVIEQIREHVEL